MAVAMSVMPLRCAASTPSVISCNKPALHGALRTALRVYEGMQLLVETSVDSSMLLAFCAIHLSMRGHRCCCNRKKWLWALLHRLCRGWQHTHVLQTVEEVTQSQSIEEGQASVDNTRGDRVSIENDGLPTSLQNAGSSLCRVVSGGALSNRSASWHNTSTIASAASSYGNEVASRLQARNSNG